MNPDELEALLAAVSSSDRRTVGKADAQFWAAMAREGSWTLPTAMRALVQFRHTRPGEWLEPGHLSGIIREARRKAAATFVVPDVPEGLTGRDYPRWYRAELLAHTDRIMHAWAGGEAIPETPAGAAEVTGHSGPVALPVGMAPPELRDQIARGVAYIGRERPPPSIPVRLPRRTGGDPARRAEARAELDTRRSTQGMTGDATEGVS